MLSERKKLSENRPPEGAKPARENRKWPLEGLRTALLGKLGPTWTPRPLGSRLWAALGALLGRFWRSWSRLGAFLAAPGASRAAPGRLLGVVLGLTGGCFGRSGRCLWRYVKYNKNVVFYHVFGLPEPPGSLRNRSKIGPGCLLDVSWDQRSVWRGQVELHRAVLDPM